MDLTVPTVSIEKQASTEAVVNKASLPAIKANMVKHPIDEGLKLNRNFMVQQDGTVLHSIDTIREVSL